MTFTPSRIDVMKVYSKRVMRWRSNSWPYLTGDAFADLADAVFRPPRFRGRHPSLKELRRARVIFINSSDFLSFLGEFGSSIEAKFLIAGNSDMEFHNSINLPKSVKGVLLQNSFISNNRNIFTLPIGIENYRWGVNGNPRFITPTPIEMSNSLTLFGPFGHTHPMRAKVKEEFGVNGDNWNYVTGYIPPNEFDVLSSKFKYIACVRGNGIDTHRFWETLYRGRIPIVAANEWADSLDYLKLPFKKIEDWEKSKLADVVRETSFQVSPTDISQLWMPYWVDFIKSKIN
jgi:hypothetical protein